MTFRDPNLLADWADYVLSKTRYAIESFGPRPPGSDGETAAQRLVAEELGRWTTGGEVRTEPFSVAPRAFMSVPLVTGLLLAAAIGAHWISLWLAVSLSGLVVVVLAAELGLYRQFYDPLFPKRTSHNVAAVQPPQGKIARRLVVNAHPDAAFEWRLHYRLPAIFPWFLPYTLAAVALVFLTDIALLPLSHWSGPHWPVISIVAGWINIAGIPAALLGICYTNFAMVSPGANDNLSGMFIALGLARYLNLAEIRLERTEVVYLITGAEEAGTRGAAEYARRHSREWKDVETIFIALDTFRDLEYLRVYRYDRNGVVRHDAGVCSLLREAGRRCGMELEYGSVYIGSTDAAVFTDWGVRSAALCAIDPRPARFYHTRLDHFTNMSRECIAKSCEVLLEALWDYDRNGLDGAAVAEDETGSELSSV